MSESLDEFDQSIVVVAVDHDLLVESFQLLLGWQLAVNYEERSLEECGLLSKLLNGITTIFKHALISIDERNA
jgi:hypothetical protein